MISLLGSLLGFGTSFLPKLLGFFERKRDQAHELRMIEAQAAAQERIEQAKLMAIHAEADIREIEALHQEHQAVTKGASQWVVNLAASVRPVLTYLFFLEFAVLTVAVFFGWIDQEQYRMVWNQDMQGIWAAVVSFWFGSRTFNRRGHS